MSKKTKKLLVISVLTAMSLFSTSLSPALSVSAADDGIVSGAKSSGSSTHYYYYGPSSFTATARLDNSFAAVCDVKSWTEGIQFTYYYCYEPFSYTTQQDSFTGDTYAVLTKYNGNAKSVNIPSTLGGYPVKKIGDNAFDGCSSLTDITIPDSVTNIGYCAFINCDNLESINVDSNNGYYESYDGILFTKDMKTLICCPSGNYSFDIPCEVEHIDDYAFYNCRKLTYIFIPIYNIESIGCHAFYGCDELTDITISADVDLEASDLASNSKLTTIWGTPGTRVEQYARKYGIRFIKATSGL